MNPVSKKLRDQIDWYINGKPLKVEQWVCMSFMGRNAKSDYLPDEHKFADLKIVFPKPVFIEIYKISYNRVIESEKEDEPYLWGELPLYDKLRDLDYPEFETLIKEHQALAEAIIVDDDVDISELIYMNPPTDESKGYALKRLDGISITKNNVVLTGKVSYRIADVIP